MRNPLIAALDLPSPEAAINLAKAVSPYVGAFKVGSELFTASGPTIVRELRSMGATVFLDLKFHDIPNTVAKAVAAAVRLDVQMLTIHTSGGLEMMRAAEKSAVETAAALGRQPPLVLGVTVLTSMDSGALAEGGVTDPVGCQVERLASLASKAGLRGLVCSPLEITGLKQLLGEIQLVTPGIRGPGDKSDDQKRTLTAAEAIAAGADWLVVGRPIYAAADPASAARKLLEELRS